MSTSAPLFRRTVSSKLYLKRKRVEDAKEKEAKEEEEARLRKMVNSVPIPLNDSPSTVAQSSTADMMTEHASTSGKNPVNTL